MIRIRARLCLAIAVIAVGRRIEDPKIKAAAERPARLAKSWPVPRPSPAEANRFWILENGYLSLREPDSTAPPEIPGRNLLTLHCDPAHGLSVETGIVIQQDVPLPYPPFDTLVLEGGEVRVHTAMTRLTDGYTARAGGDFRIGRDMAHRLLSAPFIIVRPLYLGERSGQPADEDIAERYATPPAAQRDAFLAGCRLD